MANDGSHAPLPPLPLKPICLTGLCHVCKQLLPTSAFCKGDSGKYYACKACEAARQKARKRFCLCDGEPFCNGCEHVMTGPTTVRRMHFYECAGCHAVYRYRKNKDGSWCAGKKQCNWCDGFGCTSVRHNGKRREPVVDVDETDSMSSGDDLNECD